LANEALAGRSVPVSLGDLTAAAQAINDGFDKCRILEEFFEFIAPRTGNLTALELNKTDMLLFPNPSIGKVHVVYKTNEVGKAIFRIYDLKGNMMLRHVTEFVKGINEEYFDLTSLQPGIYMVQVKMEEGVMVKRFVIQN
jgi:hypothetical protein